MSSETSPLPPEASHTAPEASDTSHTFPPHPHQGSDVPPTPPSDAPQVTVVDLTPALQMRLSLLRRLWLASVEMRAFRFSSSLGSGGAVSTGWDDRARLSLTLTLFEKRRGSAATTTLVLRDRRTRPARRLDRYSRDALPRPLRQASRAVPGHGDRAHLCRLPSCAESAVCPISTS